MTPTLSPNAQAILLLTAPLIVGNGATSPDLLKPSEYKRLACRLHELQRQPADLLLPDAPELLRECHPVIDESRLLRLLERGYLLSHAVERWQTRAMWVISRADDEYPRRLKERLRDDAPAVLYGCGDIDLLETGGLAVVGSRHVDDALIDYTMAVGRLAARAGRTIVSGGAKGIDQAAMRGALEAGGKVCGVLADSLERSVMIRENRDLLLDGRLVLVSPYDPNAGFNVGNAMQRNKLIYALADAALVVSSDINKGGTWAGAVEQLDKLGLVPVYVRSSGEPSAGLNALRKKGAIPWPDPQDPDVFEAVFNVAKQTPPDSQQPELPLFSDAVLTDATPAPQNSDSIESTPEPAKGSLPSVVSDSENLSEARAARESILENYDQSSTDLATDTEEPSEISPADEISVRTRKSILMTLKEPKKVSEVAAALRLTNAQAKAMLDRLVEENELEKQKKPVRYILKQKHLFE